MFGSRVVLYKTLLTDDVVEGKGWKDNYVAFQEDPAAKAKTVEEVEEKERRSDILLTKKKKNLCLD